MRRKMIICIIGLSIIVSGCESQNNTDSPKGKSVYEEYGIYGENSKETEETTSSTEATLSTLASIEDEEFIVEMSTFSSFEEIADMTFNVEETEPPTDIYENEADIVSESTEAVEEATEESDEESEVLEEKYPNPVG